MGYHFCKKQNKTTCKRLKVNTSEREKRVYCSKYFMKALLISLHAFPYLPLSLRHFFFLIKENHTWNSLACCDGHWSTWRALRGGEFPEVSLRGGSQHPFLRVVSTQLLCCLCSDPTKVTFVPRTTVVQGLH